ncbi:hypothetical protein A2707_05595 [Candidatus Saccharibacteria bacterium RIFCSPHIGHO2_01_FULL_45_15]|nr:MAG: hypothetical protein A2707_05595 [Candidatus Saccharibacteria bacterium RIFCSPHIGHO2_01_FULL_45_15]OGL28920.1 MAG: hypothetical protein A3C39_05810 [Candidatus Saccharibacteria bacterium RIFCSPHIGHO2_02_FULL_46_12]OGL31933.1 MAG: hypothetical protein A3E76_01540 [Candidatus Saccharibacteria bacterium RIFCSPHIGHO2_12_FULL_44_22]
MTARQPSDSLGSKRSTSLLDNERFYILILSFSIAVIVPALLQLSIANSQLVLIRTEQLYGLLSLLFWYIALLVSPLSSIIGKQRMRIIIHSRRAIGVSAAFFAILHGSVALFGQLGGFAGIERLPELFQWSMLAGAIAAGVLIIMAVTSFDSVVRRMTPRRWKWLHRTGYIGGILVLIHIWTVGTHVSYTAIQLTAFVALVVLGVLEAYRIARASTQKDSDKLLFSILFLTITVSWSVLLLFIPAYIENYHTARHTSSQGVSHE